MESLQPITTRTGTARTRLTTLSSFETLAPGVFTRENSSLRISAFGNFGDNANAKALKLWWGVNPTADGTPVDGGELVCAGTATSNGGWMLEAVIIRVDVSAQIGNGMIFTNGVGNVPATVELTADETQGITVAITGASTAQGAADDVVGMSFQMVLSYE